jgi:hypothetical protein
MKNKNDSSFGINKAIIIIIIVIIICFIILGCYLSWYINCILLQSANNEFELKSARDSLINANTLTFLVTLIVGLLASLLVFRIDKIDHLVNENEKLKSTIENTLNDFVSNSVKFDVLLTQIESIYYKVNMIVNITNILILHSSKDFRQVGVLCSQIDNHVNKIVQSLEHEKIYFSEQTQEIKEILYNYTDHTVLLLGNISLVIKNNGGLIFSNVDILCNQMKRIKKQIGDINIENKK